MGQKTNPLALRLRYNNLDFDNIWFNQNNYAQCLIQNLQLKEYTKNFSKHLNIPENKIALNLNFKHNNLYSFFCIPVKTRFPRSRQFKLNTRIPRFWTRIRFKQAKYTNKFKFFQKNRYNRLKNYQISTSKLERLIQTNNTYIHIQKNKNSNKNLLINNKLTSTLPITTNDIKKNNYLNYLFKDIQKLQSISTNNQKSKKSLNTIEQLNNYQISKFKLRYFLLQYFFALQNGNILNYSDYNNKKSKSNTEFSQIQQFYKTTLSTLPSLNFTQKSKKYNDNINKTTIPYYFYNTSPENKKYQNYITNYISTQYNFPFQSFNFWLQQDFQHAGFLADEIVFFLEKRIPFKRIKHRIAKEMSNFSWIKGIRLEFSGRVNARSKKAQRAKHEVIKLGQTSLHVFNYKIDYAARTAFTSYGSVGIKVWICYK